MMRVRWRLSIVTIDRSSLVTIVILNEPLTFTPPAPVVCTIVGCAWASVAVAVATMAAITSARRCKQVIP